MQVDFDSLKINEQTEGRLLTADQPDWQRGAEVERLRGSETQGVPLIIDNAYGTPFPNIIYQGVQPVWDEDMIVCMSLSKLGLPGLRAGIVISERRPSGSYPR